MPDIVQKIKKTVDIVELASLYTDLHFAGNNTWQGPCPHPDHEDTNPSFTVWRDTQTWACYGCHIGKKDLNNKNYGTDCIAFIQWLKNKSFSEALKELAEYAGIEINTNSHQQVLYKKYASACKQYERKLSKTHREYLQSRGLDTKDIVLWRIGSDGNCIAFPLLDRQGRVLGFSRRLSSDKKSSYKNSPNSDILQKKYYLYGMNFYDPDFPEVRITEGCMDVVLAHKSGVKNIVATLGTAFGQGHVDLIKSLGKIPVLCFDGDEPGRKATIRAGKLLSKNSVHAKVLSLPEGKDMGDLALFFKEEGLEKHVNQNTVLFGQYLVRKIIDEYDTRLNQIRLDIAPKLKEVLSLIEDPIESQIVRAYIREKVGIDLPKGGLVLDLQQL